MRTLMQLVGRNMKVYLRNKSSVFFSFMTMIIILLLNTVFLGDINKKQLIEMLSVDDKLITYITGSWLMAGLVVVNAVMVTSIMLAIMVEDEEQHRLIAFLVAPVKRLTLTLSYIIAACLMSLFFVLITLGISQFYFWYRCEEVLSASCMIRIIGYAAANIFSIVSILMCVATLMKSASSYGAFNTTMGTVIGFIAGIYLPIGALPIGVQNVLKCFPILHGTALIREAYTREAISKGFNGAPVEVIEGYKQYMGITIDVGGKGLSLGMNLLVLLASGIIFMMIAIWLVSHKESSDR